MEQNIEAKKQLLSTASMLSAIGVTLMYGLSIVIALLSSNASSVIMIIGLSLYIVGLYNMISALRGVNDVAVTGVKTLFNAIVMTIGAVLLVYVILLSILWSSMSFDNIGTIITFIRILTFVLIAAVIFFTYQCRAACKALSKIGLKSMKHCGIAYTIQLVIFCIPGLFAFIALFSTGHTTSYFGSLGLEVSAGLISALAVIYVIASLVMCIFMIIGWWSVRPELQRMTDIPERSQNI